MNLRTIETGSQVVHNGLLILPLAGITIGHGLRLRIDPVRPPPSIVYRHVQISPRMTCGGRPGIGVETTIPVTDLVIDTTVRTTCRRTVTTAPKEIRGGRRMNTGHGPLRLLRDPLGLITLQLLALRMMRRTAFTPLHRHHQTPLLHPLPNDLYHQNANQYPSPFLQRSQSPPNSAGPLYRLILLGPPKTSQKLIQVLRGNLPHHHRNVQNGYDVLVRRRSWLTAARSQDVARFMTMTLQQSWEKGRLGKTSSFTWNFLL